MTDTLTPDTGVGSPWLPMKTAPKNGEDEVLILFDSATVDIVRLCRWNDGFDYDGHSPTHVGWWSYEHSVTQSKINTDILIPVGWMPFIK